MREILWDIHLGLRNLWTWLPIIWQDRQHDWTFLTTLLEFKLRRMERFYRLYSVHAGASADARNMLICAALCKRLSTDDYVPISTYFRSHHSIEHDEMLARQDNEYLGRMFRKHLRKWWD
jgi:hypothetical protein